MSRARSGEAALELTRDDVLGGCQLLRHYDTAENVRLFLGCRVCHSPGALRPVITRRTWDLRLSMHVTGTGMRSRVGGLEHPAGVIQPDERIRSVVGDVELPGWDEWAIGKGHFE